jgi:uncharacterized GH25 family protein
MKIAIFRNCSAVLLVFTLLVQPLSANICVNEKLEPLKRLRGVVVDYQGEPIPDATISVTRSGTEVKATKTDSRGEFSFDGLGAGQYELKAEAKNFVKFDFPIKIAKPSAKSTQKIWLQLAVGGQDCSDIRLIGR